MKLLIAIPSPRDIPEFAEATSKLNHDKFWVKYHRHYEALTASRDFFLAHEEYTHLAMCPDDLIIKPEHVERLLADLKEHDYPVLGGLCPINRDSEFAGMVNISLTHVTNPYRPLRRYEFMTEEQWKAYSEPKPIVQTKFQGFPFSIIRRDIVERFPFSTDGKYNGKLGRGMCSDVVFCYELAKAGIPLYSDLNVYMWHIPDSRELNFFVGVKEPYTFFESSH